MTATTMRDYSALRAILPDRRRYVCWYVVERDGEPTKIPINPHTGQHARSNDPATWGTFDEACAALDRYRHAEGLGYMFVEDDGLVGMDVDDVLDPVTGHLNDLGQWIVSQLPTYCEVSWSGTGIKFIAAGVKPGPRCKIKDKPGLEMYCRVRLFALTGQRLDGTPAAITDCQAGLDAIYTYLFPPQPERPAQPLAAPLNCTVDEAFTFLRGTRDGAKFDRLLAGDNSDFGGDESDGDLSFCNLLRFAGLDAATIDAVVRGSARMRPKWDKPARSGETYGEGTLARAMIGDVRTPPERNPPTINLRGAAKSPIPVAVTSEASETVDNVNGCPAQLAAALARVAELEAQLAHKTQLLGAAHDRAAAEQARRVTAENRLFDILQIINSGTYTPAQAIIGVRALREIEMAREHHPDSAEPVKVWLPELVKGTIIRDADGEPLMDPTTNREKRQTSMAPATASRALRQFAELSGAIEVAETEDEKGRTRLVISETAPTVAQAMRVAAERFVQQDRRRGPGRSKPVEILPEPTPIPVPACDVCPPETPVKVYCTGCSQHLGNYIPESAPFQFETVDPPAPVDVSVTKRAFNLKRCPEPVSPRILALVDKEQGGRSLSLEEIALALGMSAHQVRPIVRKLHESGQLKQWDDGNFSRRTARPSPPSPSPSFVIGDGD